MDTQPPESTPPLIASVPGVTPKDVVVDPVHTGQIVSIPESEFKGDPSQVQGRPSHPNYMDSTGSPDIGSGTSNQTEEAQPPASADLITELPPELKNGIDSSDKVPPNAT